MHQCYFLVFRIKTTSLVPFDWDNPTGGLVTEPCDVINGHPVPDIALTRMVLELRYHCHHDEQLVLAEVFDQPEKQLAAKLHQRWEDEAHEFLELMRV